MSAEVVELPGLGPQLRAWLTGNWREVVAVIGLLLSIVLFLGMLPGLAANSSWRILGRNAAHGSYVVGLLLLATFMTRTVTLRTAISWWLVGFFPLVALNYLLQEPLGLLLGTDATFVAVIWVPIVEELTKALPLVLAVLLAVRSSRLAYGPSDLLVLAAAVGAGFAFHEDALWGRSVGSGFELLGAGALFPGFVSSGGQLLLIGHLGWTVLFGASLAAWLVLRWHGRSRLMWLLPLGALVMVTFDHMSNNLVAGATTRTALVRAAEFSLTRLGYLFAMLIVLSVIGAVLVEHRQLRVSQREPIHLPVLTRQHLRAALDAPDVPSKLLRLYACGQYLRAANAARYLAAAQRRPLAVTRPRPEIISWGRLAGTLD